MYVPLCPPLYVIPRAFVITDVHPGIYIQVDNDRGQWLYRGYLVGVRDGNMVGRWRDVLSPSDSHGYEGCFAMSRRR